MRRLPVSVQPDDQRGEGVHVQITLPAKFGQQSRQLLVGHLEAQIRQGELQLFPVEGAATNEVILAKRRPRSLRRTLRVRVRRRRARALLVVLAARARTW